MRKRIIALVLAFLMVVGMFPMNVYTSNAEENTPENTETTETNVWDTVSEPTEVCLIVFLDKSNENIVFYNNPTAREEVEIATAECPDYLILTQQYANKESGEAVIYQVNSADDDFYFSVLSQYPLVEAKYFSSVVEAKGLYATLKDNTEITLYKDLADISECYSVSVGELSSEYVVADFCYDSSSFYNWCMKLTPDEKWPEGKEEYLWLKCSDVAGLSQVPTHKPEKCDICGGENCSTEHQWCDICIGYDCGVNHEGEIPQLKNDENGVSIYAESFPEGVTLKVESTDVKEQLSEFGINADKKVFGLDISVLNIDNSEWQPSDNVVLVKIPVSEAYCEGTKIGILHTHEGKTEYIGYTEVLPDGTIEFYTEGFSEFAGFTVDFHYNGVDFSIDGMTSILLSELFEEMGIEEDATQAVSVEFSDITLVQVTQESSDWKLTSLQAFSTNELLSVSFNDGHSIVIDVTDVLYYEAINGNTYNVPYWNIDSEGVLRISVNYDSVPMTIYLYKESVASLSWDIVSGGSYIDTSGKRTLTVNIKNNIPIESDAVDIDLNPGGRVHLDVYRYIDITYSDEGKGATGMPSNVVDKKITTSTNNYTVSTSVPKLEGYIFDKWVGSNGIEYSSGTTASLTSNVVLTAKWKSISYNVSFNGNGATDGSMSNQTFTYGTAQNLKANSFTRSYTVTYNANGGNCSTEKATATATFNGWEDRGSIVYKGSTYDYTKFDAPYYANTYSDLMNAFGYNKYNLLNHWVIQTVNGPENRVAVGTSPGLYPNQASVNNLSTSNDYTVPLYANWTLASVTLPTATRSGYTFSGWSDGIKIYEAGTSYTPTAKVTLTAQWSENEYKLNFDYNGGNRENSTNTTSGPYIVKTGSTNNNDVSKLKPVRTGYDFTGWYTSDGTKVYDSDGICVTGIYWNSSKQWIGTDDLMLYAHWTAKMDATYIVHYYLENSTKNVQDDKIITGKTYGQQYTESAPTIMGYTLVGNSSQSVTAGYSDNEITFYYQLSGYKVTYIYSGIIPDGVPKLPGEAEYTVGTSVIVADSPTMAGYTFSGWTTSDVSITNGSFTMPDNAVTLSGAWTANTYNVTYNSNEGTGSIANQNKIYGADLVLSNGSGFSRTGYTLTGWNTQKDGNGTKYDLSGIYVVDAPLNLYAQWQINNYTVTVIYDSNQIAISGMENFTLVDNKWQCKVPYQTVVNIGFTAETGYEITDVKINNTEVGTFTGSIKQLIEGNTEIVVTSAPIKYIITYNLDGGSLPDEKTNPISYFITSDDITLNNPTKAGYTFAGWTGTDLTQATQTVTIAKGNTGNRAYTATWTENEVTISYVAEANGKVKLGTSETEALSVKETVKVWTGVPQGATAVPDAGYKFVGWYKADDTLASSAATPALTKEASEMWQETTYTAKFERSLVDLTITAEGKDANQSYIFTITGMPSDGSDFATMQVVLAKENNFKVVIKDVPVGTYKVEEVNEWSWREKIWSIINGNQTVTYQEVYLDEGKTVPFGFADVDNKYWLSGLSYGRWKGGN